MTPDGLVSLFAGGGVLGVIAGLAVVLIRQVSSAGRMTEQQTAGWERLVTTSQSSDAAKQTVIDALLSRVDTLERENRDLRRKEARCPHDHT